MTQAGQVAALDQLVQTQYKLLLAEQPEQALFGGEVLLGKSYAAQERGVLMLGLNPGVAPGQQSGIQCRLHSTNYLLDPAPFPNKIRYWTHARAVFGEPQPLNVAMQSATFSFCSPFRTPNWVGLSRDYRESLMRYSRPILERMMTDCDPSIVIVSGMVSVGVFKQLMLDSLVEGPHLGGGGDGRGTYQWNARDIRVMDRSLTLVQIPHLSRAGSRPRLRECRTWLADIVAQRLRLPADPMPRPSIGMI